MAVFGKKGNGKETGRIRVHPEKCSAKNHYRKEKYQKSDVSSSVAEQGTLKDCFFLLDHGLLESLFGVKGGCYCYLFCLVRNF